jgi:uncharacterized cupredoxin-like copper-binding protein
VGSVQRLATVVIIGLVALSTVLFLYLGDEDNRITAKEEHHQEMEIERAIANYIGLCLQCHGPAGEGYTEPGAQGTGRIGAPLGGVLTSLNQEGINAAGTPVSGGVEARAEHIHNVIANGLVNPDGSIRMPAFAEAADGPLNPQQVDEMVTMIQHVDWNRVYNEAVFESGGYPTPPPSVAEEPVQTEDQPVDATVDEDTGIVYTIENHDIFFAPDQLEIPANVDVIISLPNVGNAPHNFSIDELGISVDIAPGATEQVVINAAPGEYEFYCDVPGHLEAGMVGTLIVSEDVDVTALGDAGTEPIDAGTGDPGAVGETGETAEEPVDETEAAEPVTVIAHDIYFDPTDITIPADTDVTFVIPNEGAALHDFVIDELDISTDDIAPGSQIEIVINAPAGTYEFYCSIPGHREAGMWGTLTVT